MKLADGPRVTLDELSTELVLVGLREDAHRRRRELDRLARERLPRALGRALDGSLESGDAVVRIRRLEVELDVESGELAAGRLATAWSRRLARVLREELRKGPGPNLAVFESHDDFMAAYVESLVDGSSSRSWAFRDFAALEHLDAADAAVELLAVRPRTLTVLARRLGRGEKVAGLARLLEEHRCRRLLEAADGDDGEDPDTASLDELLGDGPASPPSGSGPFGHGLVLVLRSLAGGRGEGRVGPRARTALALARAREEVERWPEEDRAALAALLRGRPEASLSPRRKARVPVVMEALEVGLAGPVEAVVLPGRAPSPPADEPWEEEGPERESPASTDEEAAPEPPTESEEAEEEPSVRSFRSPFAGLALAVPVVRALELPSHLGAVRVRALLEALAGPEHALRLADDDPLLDVLAPLEEDEAGSRPGEPWPEPRRSHLLGLREGRRQAVEEVADAHGWAELVGAHLAARLHRLEGSSLDYLRSQFLVRPGTVTVGPDEVRVALDGVPLSVVLRMSGMLGDRGRIPWSGNRRLVVTLAGS